MSGDSLRDAIRPVFIGGCERSGTTLLGSLLGAHPECIETPESQFKSAVWAELEDPDAQIEEAVRRVLAHWRFRVWQLPVDPTSLPRTGFANLIRALVRRYGEHRGRHGSVWIDHSPNNLRTAATLRTLFPGARFVHIVRDGRAVAASVMPLDWGPNSIWQAAPWWSRRLAHGLALETAWPREVTRVRFEDLVQNPAAALELLCDAIGLPFDAAMLRPSQRHVPAYTSAQHELVGRDPDASRATAYRERLDRREIEQFEAETFELLAYLGYPLEYGGRARPGTRSEKLRALLTEGYRRPVNRLRGRARRAAGIRNRAEGRGP